MLSGLVPQPDQPVSIPLCISCGNLKPIAWNYLKYYLLKCQCLNWDAFARKPWLSNKMARTPYVSLYFHMIFQDSIFSVVKCYRDTQASKLCYKTQPKGSCILNMTLSWNLHSRDSMILFGF